MPSQDHQFTFRVKPEQLVEIREEADRRWDGQTAAFLRESVRLHLAMRRKFGPRFELIVSELLDGNLAEAVR